jgi:hypothetical protein
VPTMFIAPMTPSAAEACLLRGHDVRRALAGAGGAERAQAALLMPPAAGDRGAAGRVAEDGARWTGADPRRGSHAIAR